MPLLHPLNYLVIILNEEPQYPLFGHVHVGSLKTPADPGLQPYINGKL